MGTGITSTQATGAAAAGASPPRAADAGTVARTGSSEDVAAFARAHPEQRIQLDDALVARGRYGDVFALSQRDRAAAAGAHDRTRTRRRQGQGGQARLRHAVLDLHALRRWPHLSAAPVERPHLADQQQQCLGRADQ